MTPSTDSWAGIAALAMFILRELWNIYREKNKPKIDNAQAESTQAQAAISTAQADKIKADIQRDILEQVHKENQALVMRVDEAERELASERNARREDNEKALRMITELQGALRERDQQLSLMQASIIERDSVILDLQTQITALKRTQASGATV